MVEHRLAKARVASSNLVSRSKFLAQAFPAEAVPANRATPDPLTRKRDSLMKLNSSRQFSVLLLLAFLLSTCTAIQAQSRRRRSSRAKTITASGCLKAGVEAGCLVLTDPKTNVMYQLSFKGKKPAVGTAIRFTGTAHGGITICMQGIGVSVKSWTRTRMKCPQE